MKKVSPDIKRLDELYQAGAGKSELSAQAKRIWDRINAEFEEAQQSGDLARGYVLDEEFRDFIVSGDSIRRACGDETFREFNDLLRQEGFIIHEDLFRDVRDMYGLKREILH